MICYHSYSNLQLDVTSVLSLGAISFPCQCLTKNRKFKNFGGWRFSCTCSEMLRKRKEKDFKSLCFNHGKMN